MPMDSRLLKFSRNNMSYCSVVAYTSKDAYAGICDDLNSALSWMRDSFPILADHIDSRHQFYYDKLQRGEILSFKTGVCTICILLVGYNS